MTYPLPFYKLAEAVIFGGVGAFDLVVPVYFPDGSMALKSVASSPSKEALNNFVKFTRGATDEDAKIIYVAECKPISGIDF